jgi:hypothetical protein
VTLHEEWSSILKNILQHSANRVLTGCGGRSVPHADPAPSGISAEIATAKGWALSTE